MGPIITLLLQFLPQILESLMAKEAYAAANGFKGPMSSFMENGGKEALSALAASYDRCCKEMEVK